MTLTQFKSKYKSRASRDLADAYNKQGLTEASKKLGIGKGTFYYWMLACGVRITTVAVRDNEKIVIRRPGHANVYASTTKGQPVRMD